MPRKNVENAALLHSIAQNLFNALPVFRKRVLPSGCDSTGMPYPAVPCAGPCAASGQWIHVCKRNFTAAGYRQAEYHAFGGPADRRRPCGASAGPLRPASGQYPYTARRYRKAFRYPGKSSPAGQQLVGALHACRAEGIGQVPGIHHSHSGAN